MKFTDIGGNASRNQFDDRNYEQRLELASANSHFPGDRKLAAESVEVYDRSGDCSEAVVSSAAAHRLGLIHKTADVLLLLPDRRLAVQRRSSCEATLPSRYGLSAGGHLDVGEEPVTAGARETAEELGLHVSVDRLLPLHASDFGWPLYFVSLEYVGPNGTLNVMKAGRDAPFTVLPTSTALISQTPSKQLEELDASLPWDPPHCLDGDLRLVSRFFNQEITYYYVVVLDHEEFCQVRPNPSELATVELLSLRELQHIADDPVLATDTLMCLRRHDAFKKITTFFK